MKSLLILIACIFLLGACNSNEEESNLPEKMPEDFNFVLKYGFEARNIIDTYENTYTKNMIEDDDITIDMTLSDAEKEAVYKEMQAADILKSVEDASKVTCAHPHEENKFNLTLNGETYEMKWITSYCEKKADRKLQDFQNLYRLK